MCKDVITLWSKEKKLDFLKEGARRVFYKSFALYYSSFDNISQLVVADYRTGFVNNYYYICMFDTSKMNEDVKETTLLKTLNHVIRKINHDDTRIVMENR